MKKFETIAIGSKGQTMVEFLLVFVVLLLAASGVFHLHKAAWKKRYENTQAPYSLVPTSAKGAAAKVSGSGYVK